MQYPARSGCFTTGVGAMQIPQVIGPLPIYQGYASKRRLPRPAPREGRFPAGPHGDSVWLPQALY
jgi:hypothetical protein